MAPVAGGVSDAEENRFILLSGLLERLFTPGIPIDRVISMLKEIW
jgi:hypothetical protein